jgi:hypothetical protein
LALGTNESIFAKVRSALVDAANVSATLEEIVNRLDLASLYANWLNPAMPSGMQCNQTCIERLKGYNRRDVFEQQLDRIERYVDGHGTVHLDCLTQFEHAATDFLGYWKTPLDLHNALNSELSDNWREIGHKLLRFADAVIGFVNRLRGVATYYFESDFTIPMEHLKIGFFAVPIVSALCMTGVTGWLLNRHCFVATALIINSANVIAFAVIYGTVLSYVGFLESSIREFDQRFEEVNATTLAIAFYKMFECPTGDWANSTRFYEFTSGSELELFKLMVLMDRRLLDEINRVGIELVNGLPYFAMADNGRLLLPYYDSEDYEAILARSIMNDALIPPCGSVYHASVDETERNIVSEHCKSSESFCQSFFALFGPGGDCSHYRLSEISKCPASENDNDYAYLANLPVTQILKEHRREVQAALKEFSVIGTVYQTELKLMDLMTLIVKNYLYQVSNALAVTTTTVSRVHAEYANFLDGSDQNFQKGRRAITKIVNGSCEELARQYNLFRELVMKKLPELATVLFVLMFVVIIMSFLMTLAMMLLKAVIRGGETESYELSSTTATLPVEDLSSSTETTFCDKDAINVIRVESSTSVSPSFQDLRVALPFTRLPSEAPSLDLEMASLGHPDSNLRRNDFNCNPPMEFVAVREAPE